MSSQASLTRRQQQILEFIARRHDESGYPPSRAEIAEHFGMRSLNGVKDHLKALDRKGYIELRDGVSRGIRLLTSHPQGLPLVGRVAAGSPLLASEHIEEYVPADLSLFRPRADFLLRVQGMSMRDAGILDGDLLAVHKQETAETGQIVIARLEDEVTVKRLKRDGRQPHRIELIAENPAFAPIKVDLRECSLVIEGIAVGLVRSIDE
jgi:repressor LexA